jgi:Arc/MetJ-type ribon-helix-helix transcriptional regulator
VKASEKLNELIRDFFVALGRVCITDGFTMKTLTVKIPETLDEKLRRKSASENEPLSEIVRRALRRELEDGTTRFADLAEPFRGMFSGPEDLSTREGYGSGEHR